MTNAEIKDILNDIKKKAMGGDYWAILSAADKALAAMDGEAEKKRQKATSAKLLSLCKYLSKNMSAINKNRRPMINPYCEKDGYQYFVDTFAAVKIGQSKALPEEDVAALKTTAEPVDMERFFGPLDAKYQEYDMPTVEFIKDMYNTKKAEIKDTKGKRVGYSFGTQFPVDCAKLIKILEAVGDCKVYINGGSLVRFIGDDIEAILSPCRRSDKLDEGVQIM